MLSIINRNNIKHIIIRFKNIKDISCTRLFDQKNFLFLTEIFTPLFFKKFDV